MTNTVEGVEFPETDGTDAGKPIVQFATGGNPQYQQRTPMSQPTGEQRAELTEYEKLMRQSLEGRF